MDNTLLLQPNSAMEPRAMVELIDYFDYPIDVKDVRTGKYIHNNIAASSVSGLSKEERVGMDITIVTSAKTAEEGYLLLSLLGFPFTKNKGA